MIFDVAGRKVFAATGGQPVRTDRPTAVFLHGAGMDHSVWTLPGRYVAHHGGTTLALALPGHGKSEGRPSLASRTWRPGSGAPSMSRRSIVPISSAIPWAR